MSSNARVVQFVGRESYLGSIEVPRLLTTEIQVQEGDQTVVYRGQAFGLYFDGLDIRGNASISRIRREKYEMNITRRPCWWKPWKKEIVGTEERVDDTLLWSFRASNGTSGNPDWGCSYFIHRDGRVARDRIYGFAYRGKLVGVAATGGVVLSDQLLEAVFQPIDEKLVQLYHQVAGG